MTKRFIVTFFAIIVIANVTTIAQTADSITALPNYELVSPTFLGNYERNYYGDIAPDTLTVIWKHYLGKGKTTISRKRGDVEWAGAGWTGQPLLVKEDSNLYIIQGAYDHHLKKIDASNGNLIWQYKFDDVIKGTGTIWESPDSLDPENKLVILQGSRLGYGKYLDTKYVPSYRAVSYFTGEELWRYNSKMTRSYSRDVDGSALIYMDTAYLGLENSLFTKFNPDYRKADTTDGMFQPEVFQQIMLYNKGDAMSHGGNLVTESSPCILDSVIYVASGTGHIFGYDLKTDTITWDFFIGSDIDGSAIVTHDSCLIITIEKQYIEGQGGVMKLNPKKKPTDAVVWFFPTIDKEYASWEGGVIGSASINDKYRKEGEAYLAAFSAIDGYTYVINHTSLDTVKAKGPNLKYSYSKPKLVYKYKTGASISTPIIVNNKLIAAGYGGLYLFEFDKDLNFRRIAKHGGTYEATPVVHNKKIYVASRNGYFYCLGE